MRIVSLRSPIWSGSSWKGGTTGACFGIRLPSFNGGRSLISRQIRSRRSWSELIILRKRWNSCSKYTIPRSISSESTQVNCIKIWTKLSKMLLFISNSNSSSNMRHRIPNLTKTKKKMAKRKRKKQMIRKKTVRKLLRRLLLIWIWLTISTKSAGCTPKKKI